MSYELQLLMMQQETSASDVSKQSPVVNLTNTLQIVIYVFGVVNIRNLQVSMTLES